MGEIAAYKRVSLAGLFEGWTDECYAVVRPATYMDMTALDDIKADMSRSDQAKWQLEFVKEHFVRGVAMTTDQEGALVTQAMSEEDTALAVDLTDKLFLTIIGTNIDPKDLRQAAVTTLTQPVDGTPTGEPSSTAPSTESATNTEEN